MIFKRSIQNKTFTAVMYILTLAMLSACSGGGDSGSKSGGTQTIVTGTALAPSGTVAQLNNQTFMYAINEFLFPSAGAAIIGLEPVQGALVELIEINNAGEQVGSVQATATTSITGDYELTLPAGVNLMANLVVRISGTNVDMRAIVVETAVDITPLSEFLLRKFIASGTPLSTLTVSDVVKLSGHVKEFDVAATADLTSMIAALESQLGPFIDDSIIAISGTPGSASAFAGEYHHHAYRMGYYYENDTQFPPLEAAQSTRGGGGPATLTDDGGANIGAITGTENSTSAGQGASDNLSYWLGYEVGIYQGGAVLSNLGTVDSNGNVNLTFPFSDEFNAGNDHGYRTPPTTQNFYASGVAGLLFATGVDLSATYRAIDTNNDGTTDTVDMSAYVGHLEYFQLAAVAPQASGITTGGVAGNYGSVYLLNYFANNGFSGVETGVTASTIDSSGISTETAQDSIVITRTPLTMTPGTVTLSEEVAENTLNTGTTTVNSNGQLTATEDGSTVVEHGFVSNNGEFAMLTLSDSQGTAPDFTLVGSGQILAVRKPTSGAPDLSGRIYRIMGIEKQMVDTGQIRIQRLRGDDDRLTFNSDSSQVSVSYNGLDIMTRDVDNGDFMTTTVNTSGTINHAVTIASDGAIGFTETVPGTDGHTREWKGYISISTNIIILSAVERANDNSQYGQGIYIAIPVN